MNNTLKSFRCLTCFSVTELSLTCVIVKLRDMCSYVTAAYGNEDSSSINEQPLRVLPALLHAWLRRHYSTRWVETMSILQRIFFPKIRDYYGSGWVDGSRSHSFFLIENRPKIALNQY